MPRICRFAVILALLTIAALASGCYTIIGHPSPAEEGVVEEEIVEDQVYYEAEYGRPYPYYLDYYDLWYPRSHYYWSRPWWYYDDYPVRYYDYDYDYDDHYVPEKKPETRRRGATDFWRSLRSGSGDEAGPERDRETDQSNREVLNRRRSENELRRAPVQRRRTTTEKRSTKRKSQDEEEKKRN